MRRGIDSHFSNRVRSLLAKRHKLKGRGTRQFSKVTTVIDTRPGRPQVIQSCDVFVDAGGRVYANDNNGGPCILEFLK